MKPLHLRLTALGLHHASILLAETPVPVAESGESHPLNPLGSKAATALADKLPQFAASDQPGQSIPFDQLGAGVRKPCDGTPLQRVKRWHPHLSFTRMRT